jgi:fructose-1,6-bisphosphatase/inositol monophosphatase family enzyme
MERRRDGPACPFLPFYAHSDLRRRGLSEFPGKVRNLGGTAAHLALLPEGSADPIVVVLSRCDTWDVAAVLALNSGAGMQICHGIDWAPVSYGELVCAPNIKTRLPVIVGLPKLLELLEPARKGRLD